MGVHQAAGRDASQVPRPHRVVAQVFDERAVTGTVSDPRGKAGHRRSRSGCRRRSTDAPRHFSPGHQRAGRPDLEALPLRDPAALRVVPRGRPEVAAVLVGVHGREPLNFRFCLLPGRHHSDDADCISDVRQVDVVANNSVRFGLSVHPSTMTSGRSPRRSEWREGTLDLRRDTAGCRPGPLTPSGIGTYSSDASGLSRVSSRAPIASIAFARSLFGGCPSNGHFATNSSAVGGSHIGPRALAEIPPDRRPGSCCRHRGQRKVPATQCSSPRRRGLTSQTRTLRTLPICPQWWHSSDVSSAGLRPRGNGTSP
jgi:hypothetical protein